MPCPYQRSAAATGPGDNTPTAEPRKGLRYRPCWQTGWNRSASAFTPDKTKIVYCKDDNRPGSYEHVSLSFLGHEFRARSVRSKNGVMFTAFTPAISPEALKKISGEVRGWRIHNRTRHSLQELSNEINPVVRGWMTYYGRFTPAALHALLKRVNGYLVRWPQGNSGGWPRTSAEGDGGMTCSAGTAICSRPGSGRALSSGFR